jgi:hypothetical protein
MEETEYRRPIGFIRASSKNGHPPDPDDVPF